MKARANEHKGKALLKMALMVAIVGYTAAFGARAQAQFAQPLGQPDQNAQYTPPMSAPMQGDPPPPGSGSTPPGLMQGDGGAPPPVVNPGADNTTGVGVSNFTAGQSHDPGIIYVYHQQKAGDDGQSRGLKMVMTLNPASLDADQWGKIQGILGNPGNGTAATNVQATDDQIAQINEAIAPYPGNTPGPDGRKQITTDEPATIPGQPTAHYDYDGNLPTVRTFSRFLVILGVVFATVWMALGAYSMVLGHPYAGSRVIGTAAGLMLLVSAFTIWKIVRMNTFNDNTTDDQQQLLQAEHRPEMNPVPPGAPITMPPTPAAPGGRANRSGLPVQPLYGKGN